MVALTGPDQAAS